jgi:hypothetical protein
VRKDNLITSADELAADRARELAKTKKIKR